MTARSRLAAPTLLEPDTYRILLTGSRDWKPEGPVRRALREYVATAQDFGLSPVLVHGACSTGADAIADWLWTSWGWTPERHPADWDSCGPGCPSKPHRVRRQPGDRLHPGTLRDWCPKAGPRRNRKMVALGADVVLAFPLSERSGTATCMRMAREAGILVRTGADWM